MWARYCTMRNETHTAQEMLLQLKLSGLRAVLLDGFEHLDALCNHLGPAVVAAEDDDLVCCHGCCCGICFPGCFGGCNRRPGNTYERIPALNLTTNF